jgi:hypothetical protein
MIYAMCAGVWLFMAVESFRQGEPYAIAYVANCILFYALSQKEARP